MHQFPLPSRPLRNCNLTLWYRIRFLQETVCNDNDRLPVKKVEESHRKAPMTDPQFTNRSSQHVGIRPRQSRTVHTKHIQPLTDLDPDLSLKPAKKLPDRLLTPPCPVELNPVPRS